MGEFEVASDVRFDTTHVISGDSRRTLTIYKGLASGCWIVPPEWVFNSLENGSWVPEEPFELGSSFPFAPVARLERILREQSAKGKKGDKAATTGGNDDSDEGEEDKNNDAQTATTKKNVKKSSQTRQKKAPTTKDKDEEINSAPPPLFQNLVAFVTTDCTPPREDLTKIIELAGGEITWNFDSATVCIGPTTAPVPEGCPHIREVWVLGKRLNELFF